MNSMTLPLSLVQQNEDIFFHVDKLILQLYITEAYLVTVGLLIYLSLVMYITLCQDTYGHPQKLVTFRLSTGLSVNLFVRKMVTEEPNDQTPSKRALQINEAVDVSKKAKMDPKIEEDASAGFGKGDTDAHSKEIEALNQQLKQSEMVIESLRKQLTQKDFEISMLHKMISSKKKKKQTV